MRRSHGRIAIRTGGLRGLPLTILSAAVLAVTMASASQARSASNRRIITFSPETTVEERRAAVKDMGGTVVKELKTISAVVAAFPRNKMMNPRSRAPAEDSIPGVKAVEEDTYGRWIQSMPSSFAEIELPSVSSIISEAHETAETVPVIQQDDAVRAKKTAWQKRLSREIPWGVRRVNAPAAWDYTKGEEVRIAVMDTGVDLSHPDLAANIAGGINCVDPGMPPQDENGHGTHVAGIIAAVRNARGVAGVAPKARIYAVKVVDSEGGAWDNEVIAGINWCIENRMHVINMSLARPEATSEALYNAVKKAYEAGIVIIAAAGSYVGPVGYPAAYEETIAVTASGINDKFHLYSASGPEVDFIAPGISIYSTSPGRKYRAAGETSAAAPHVAGLAALAIASGIKGPEAVRKALRDAASPLPNLTVEQQGAGMIDALKLVQSAARNF